MHEWILTVILGAIGVFLIAVSYAALYMSKKHGRFISGVPLVGGIFVAAAFLLSPIKWLALLCLIDFSVWEIPYALITAHLRNRRFRKICAEYGFAQSVRDNSRTIRITIPERNEELLWPYITNLVYPLRTPKLLLAVCADRDGGNFLLVDKYERGKPVEIIQFLNNSILINDLKSKNDLTVKIEIIDAQPKYQPNHDPERRTTT
mgnify:CR=1 FL=1